MLKKINKNKKGFTLIELIVVIAILLLISVLAVVGFGNIIDNARESAERADAARLAGQLNNFNTFAHDSNRIRPTGEADNAVLTLAMINASAGGSVSDGAVNLELRATNVPADTTADAIDGNFSVAIDLARLDNVIANVQWRQAAQMWVVDMDTPPGVPPQQEQGQEQGQNNE